MCKFQHGYFINHPQIYLFFFGQIVIIRKRSVGRMYKLCKTEQSANRQRSLEQGLLQAMQIKHFDEISVSDLCAQLDVPRKAFYRYFDSYIPKGKSGRSFGNLSSSSSFGSGRSLFWMPCSAAASAALSLSVPSPTLRRRPLSQSASCRQMSSKCSSM